MARRIGITKQSVNKMMNGYTEPSLSRLYDIGDALEIDISYSLPNLKKERRYELCFEALRWNDLRRWGDVQEKVNNQVGNHILNRGRFLQDS